MIEFTGIIRDCTRCQNDRTHALGFGRSVLLDFHVEHARSARYGRHPGSAVDGNTGPAGKAGDEPVEVWLLRVLIRGPGWGQLVYPVEIPSKLFLFFHEHHLITRFGGFRRGGDSGEPSAHNQDAHAEILGHERIERVRLDGSNQPHPERIFGHHRGIFLPCRMRPGNLFAQVHPFHDPVGRK